MKSIAQRKDTKMVHMCLKRIWEMSNKLKNKEIKVGKI